jgi:proprotein convertase subtilisin/kexin type 7
MLLLLFLGVACALHTVAIKLAPGTDPRAYAAQTGVRYEETVLDYHIFSVDRLYRDSKSYLASPHVMEHYDQVRATHHKRAQVDPLFATQWHLQTTGMAGNGTGVRVAIVDDGLQHTHPEIQSNYIASLSYDFNDDDRDPMPNVYVNDGHGTSAAAVCGAVALNGHCGRGVAPGVGLVGLRLIGAPTYDYQEAKALSHRTDAIHIYSSSWGPADDASAYAGPGAVTRAALERGWAQNKIFVWAGGNGRDVGDNGNYDGYANHYATMAIGAIDFSGHQAWYSEDCACLLAVTPSSGTLQRSVTTADLLGSYGYGPGECTDQFGGTSSAAPLAAGIIALLLEKRPTLSNRDIQHVIARYATRIDEHNPDWSTGPMRHSHHYGFGLLKVGPLLTGLTSHRPVPPQVRISSGILRVERAISSSPVLVPVARGLTFIERVLVTVTFTHEQHGQLELSLTDPSGGITSILARRHPDGHRGQLTWTYSSLRHWGTLHRANQAWRLVAGGSGQGRIHSVNIDLFGYCLFV